jgi:hypothetical protein
MLESERALWQEYLQYCRNDPDFKFKGRKGKRGRWLENELVTRYAPLAVRLSEHTTQQVLDSGREQPYKPYRDQGDRRSYAMKGLLSAVRHYRPGRGARPITYIHVSILNELKHLYRKTAREESISSTELGMCIARAPNEDSRHTPIMIEQLILQNKAALPPHQIAVLRALFVGGNLSTLAEQAEKYARSELWMKKQVGEWLTALRDGGLK